MITRNGDSKAAVIQAPATHEEIQQALALLTILALGNQQLAECKTTPFRAVAERLRAQQHLTDQA